MRRGHRWLEPRYDRPTQGFVATLSSELRNFRLGIKMWYTLGRPVRPWKDMVMRMSSRVVAPSAVAFFSVAALLCSPASSQTAPSTAPLPSISVEAPKHVARPSRPERVAHAVVSRRSSSVRQTPSVDDGTPTGGSGPPLARIAALEKVASNCNGGCESSLPHGGMPWVGCSESAGGSHGIGAFSITCRDNLTYKSYVDCVETKVFLGEYPNKARWTCSSLQIAGKFRVAELRRPKRPH